MRWKFSSTWKYLLSFRKRGWRLSNYPLRYCYQDIQDIDLPSYYVEIIGWRTMVEFGDSKQEAYENLSIKLENRCLAFGCLPRPGTEVLEESNEEDNQLLRLIKAIFTADLSDSEIVRMAEYLKQLEETDGDSISGEFSS
jgi:hypothetical protein